MVIKYSNKSNYSQTVLNSKYLEIYNPPLTRDTLSVETNTMVVKSKYDRRPDLLAYDLWGNASAWWVIAHYNREILKDPIMDFKAGITITIPKNLKLPGS